MSLTASDCWWIWLRSFQYKKTYQEDYGNYLSEYCIYRLQTRLAAYLSHTPAGTSTQNILHWAQMSRSGRYGSYWWATIESAYWLGYGNIGLLIYGLR